MRPALPPEIPLTILRNPSRPDQREGSFPVGFEDCSDDWKGESGRLGNQDGDRRYLCARPVTVEFALREGGYDLD